MNIVDYIPYGEENAISRRALCKLTGLSDRAVREEISQARRNTPILSFGGGYFIPSVDEKYKARQWVNQEMRRAKSILWSIRGAKMFGGKV